MTQRLADIDYYIWLSYYENDEKKSRDYIGASILGYECDRKIWLEWKGTVNKKKIQTVQEYGKKQEIFERGHAAEEMLIKKLINAGYRVEERQSYISAFDGKLQGHIDGIIYDHTNKPFVLEIKTMGEKYFAPIRKKMNEKSFQIEKKSLLEKNFQQYITQIRLYMYYLKINDGIIIVQNKNKDWERYIEYVKPNQSNIDSVLIRIERIISYEDHIPGTLGDNEKQPFTCKMCEYFKFCYKPLEIE